MTRDIFIGVDGGATKTLARAEDAQGVLLGEGRGGPANIRLSVATSWQSVRQAVDQAMAATGLHPDHPGHRFYCAMGLAGTELTAARQAFLAVPHPFSRLVLKSDGHTACLGAHTGADGAVIAIGTGVVAWQIHHNREHQIGGWGFPHDDLGGGAWLGMQAVGLTLQWQDGRRKPSPLLTAVFDRFGRDPARLVAWACEADATRFAQLAPLVVQQAEAGTELARKLMQRAAGEIDRIDRALVRRAEGRILPCCLQGGLAPFLKPWLGEALRARLVPCRQDAVHGALLLIRRMVQTRDSL
ncbi:MAG: BadF/BadG/BcrA/BcrD ATPase family protein [Candidatus Competibacteraceae bacterium]|nr:BadF/BadG/BcrA/BcrD ATPase family protein [Candidatus Competibacteraceae bacterium]